MWDVRAKYIEEWADTYEARNELPVLIARLIQATCANLTRFDMPGRELVHLEGLDGVVECDTGNDCVPGGLSCWETSTRKDVTVKANEDYEKRTNNPIGNIQRGEAAFVFVSPRRWSKYEDWESAKKAEGYWRDVKGIRSSHLQKWIDKVPWIAAEFLHSCGRSTRGLKTLEMLWSDYANVPGRSNLEAEFILSGRQDVCEELINWLESTETMADDVPGTLRLKGASRKELLHFVAAALHSLGDEEWTKYAAIMYAVENPDFMQYFRGARSHHVVLAAGDAVTNAVDLQNKTNCRVVLLDSSEPDCGPKPLPKVPCIRLSAIGKSTAIDILHENGFSFQDARDLCEAHLFDYRKIRRDAFGV